MKSKKNILNSICFAYIFAYVALVFYYSVRICGPAQFGEYFNYLVPAISFIYDHNVTISVEDLHRYWVLFPEWAGYDEMIKLWQEPLANGDLLSYYFPTYAFWCLPAIVLCMKTGLSCVYSCMMANAVAILALLMVIFFAFDFSWKKVILLIACSMNPIALYVACPTAEPFLYALIGIAMIAWYKKSYKWAGFFISLAGSMNITIMAIGIVMIIDYLLKGRNREGNLFRFIKLDFTEIIKYALCFIPGIIPLVYFKVLAGSFFIGNIDFDKNIESTGARFWAYLLDWNYGLLPFYGLLLLLSIIMLVLSVIQRKEDFVFWMIAFYFNRIVIAYKVHINTATVGIHRYNSWSMVILIIGAILFWDELFDLGILKRVSCVVISISTLWAAYLTYDYSMCGKNAFYLNMYPLAEMILDKCPALYNPLHSTFNTRVNHIEGGGYYYETPIAYIAEDGYVRKMLATVKDVDEISDRYDSEINSDYLNIKLEKLDVDEKYINFSSKDRIIKCGRYELGDTISFVQADYNADYYYKAKDFVRDVDGVSTIGSDFELCLRVDSDCDKLKLEIEKDDIESSHPINVEVNGKDDIEFVDLPDRLEIYFTNPGADEIINIRVHFLDNPIWGYKLKNAIIEEAE